MDKNIFGGYKILEVYKFYLAVFIISFITVSCFDLISEIIRSETRAEE